MCSILPFSLPCGLMHAVNITEKELKNTLILCTMMRNSFKNRGCFEVHALCPRIRICVLRTETKLLSCIAYKR